MLEIYYLLLLIVISLGVGLGFMIELPYKTTYDVEIQESVYKITLPIKGHRLWFNILKLPITLPFYIGTRIGQLSSSSILQFFQFSFKVISKLVVK